MLTEEQTKEIKEKLLEQLDNFPKEKQEQIKSKILSMSNQEIEDFVKQNQLYHLEQKKQNLQTECIFCNIASKTIKSFPLDEDNENLAVLEINPLSKGHSMVIPKKHLDTPQLPPSTFKIAKRIASKIKKKYNPLEIKLSAQKIIGHALIEIIPLYGTEKERKKLSEEELKKLQHELEILKKPKKEKITKKKKEKIQSSLPRLKPRIP